MAPYIFQPIVKDSPFNDIESRQIAQDYGSDAPIQRKQSYDIYSDFDPYHNYYPVVDINNDYDIEELTR